MYHRKYKKILIKIIGVEDGKVICLLYGPGGSGKSTVINLVVAYAREYCDHLKHPFTCRTIVVTAMSGVAATWLHGETSHKSMGLNMKQPSEQMIDEWFDTRLVIVDEVSFASAADITKIQKHCGILKKRTFEKYGRMNIVFAGDYSQLEPVGRSPIYNGPECPAFHHYLNTFIELDGHHRFKDDPEWGERMLRFREGLPTLADVEYINEQCVVSNDHVPPTGIQIATFFNKDRDALNCSIFERYCGLHTERDVTFQDAIVIFMDNLEMQDSRKTYARVVSNAVKRCFYSQCSENSCKMKEHQSGRVDPVLKFYTGCPLMLTQNTNVLAGQANGSRLILKEVHVKSGEIPFELKLASGVRIRAFFASQVKHITVTHEKHDINPREFNVTSQAFSFRARMKVAGEEKHVSMRGHQFALISNCATTGHKLQGYTASCLLVLSWVYNSNWAYTVLSRVRTMAGMYMLKPLTTSLEKYAMPDRMKQMLETFRQNLPLKLFSTAEYNSMLQESEARQPTIRQNP